MERDKKELTMENLGDYKKRITSIVQDYKKIFPSDYNNFLVGIRLKRDLQRTKFGELSQEDYVVRILFDCPETLDSMLKLSLSPEGWSWFTSKKGGRWFAKTFKEFSISEKV